MSTYRRVNAHLAYGLNSVLNVKALVGAFSVIVKTGCGTDGALHSTNPPQHCVPGAGVLCGRVRLPARGVAGARGGGLRHNLREEVRGEAAERLRHCDGDEVRGEAVH